MSTLTGALRTTVTRLPLISPIIQEIYFRQQRATHQKFIAAYRARQAPTDAVVETPLLIGYFETGFGLGEHVRGLASALDAVGTPFAAYPYNAFTNRPRDEAPWASHYDVTNAHAINIFCMASDQTRNARRIIGDRFFANSYNILIPPWELPRAPEAWRGELDFFDELWAESRFVADAFRPIFSKPVMVVPPCINVPADIKPDRVRLGLETQKFYFLFSFDFSSRPRRKNPAAVVEAFQRAFPGRGDVGLILKISGAHERFPGVLSGLEAIALGNPRIVILQGEWKRADMLTLMASADCYVSLHRSEGFGIGMAEAMALGKPVIATGFSGNTEFLTPQTGFPVPFQMRAVAEGDYPHYEGNAWAEPDVKVAAGIMRAVALKSEEVRNKALQGQTYVRQHYNPKNIGHLIAQRLREVASHAGKHRT